MSRPRAVATRMIGSAIAIGAIGWSVHFAGLPRVELEGRLAISPSRADTTYVITESAPLELRRALYENPVVAGGQPDTIPAFPAPGFGARGAEGWGATALAPCRSLPLVVHQVTNTNATGAGSLVAAVNAASNNNFDIIVFRTGGKIGGVGSANWVSVSRDGDQNCLYIAGQTAPGDGIALHPAGTDTASIAIEVGRLGIAEDIVIRGMRMYGPMQTGWIVRNSRRVILDMISANFGYNQTGLNASTGPGFMEAVTYSNSLLCLTTNTATFSGGLAVLNHPAASDTSWKRSAHHNYWCNSTHRMPRLSGWNQDVSLENKIATGTIEVISDISHNSFGSRFGRSTGATMLDWRAHVFSSTAVSPTAYWQHEECSPLQTCDPDDPETVTTLFHAPSIFVEDSRLRDGSLTNRQLYKRHPGAGGGALPDSFYRDTMLTQPLWPVTVTPGDSLALNAGPHLLDWVGMSHRLACDGSWVAVRDSVDRMVVRHFHDETGPASPEAADGLRFSPTLDEGTPCTDTDSDGIPDAWETAQCGSTTCVTADSVSISGYLMIEHYLNGSDPDDPEPWAANGNGNGNGNGEPEATFGSGRRVYVAPLITYGVHEALRPDTAVIPLGTPFRAVLNPARDSALVVTGTDLGTPLDSATVESTVQAWDLCNARGLCSALDVRDVPIPGGDPGAMLMREWAREEVA